MHQQENPITPLLSDKKNWFSFHFPTRVEPIRNVFTLRLTEGGELVGFDLKKLKASREKFSFKTLLKRKSASEDIQGEKEPPKGIKGKLLGVVGRFRKRGEDEKSESKIGGVLTRIKGVFSRS
ncbi:MAG: hypothetical protein KKC68_02410 [Candidatus Thermoplasmatota archaeon]|nr:hypothetical protein [Candidatus Thermoplasmatota archaeon]MBU1940604.1 hypothetical protein [Candidatus Thermoplasmatota archaeon]